MRQIVAALVAGLLFGGGLAVSGMIDPAKVLNFLDITGTWDASLAFVLAGATATAAIGFALVRRRPAPLFAAQFQIPTARAVEPRLLAGATLFGIGWGLAGLCPGPALVDLAIAPGSIGLFVASMLAGMAVFRVQAD